MKNGKFQKWLCGGILVLVFAMVAGCSREARGARHLERAHKDFARDRLDRAEIGYLSAIEAMPDSSEAYAGAGAVYFLQGRLPQAYAWLKRAVELDPANASARLKLGTVYRSIGQWEKAREHALQILDQDPGNEEALLLLVDTSRTDSEFEECARRIAALPASQRDSMAAQLARGSLQLHKKDYLGAEAAFKMAADRNPKSERPWAALFAVRMASNRPDEAEEALRKAIELAPVRSPLRVNYAELKLNQGQVAEATQIATEITKRAPDYLPAWTFLASVALREGRQEECLKLAQHILAQDPSNYEALTLRAKLTLDSGDAAEAVKQFEWIVQTYGTNAQHSYNLALAHVRNRQENQAIATLDRVIALSTNHADAVLLRASLLMKQASFSPAISSLRSFIDRGEGLPKLQQARLPQAFALLARAYAGIGNINQATATYESMRKSFAGLPEVHLEAARGFIDLGQGERAKAAFLEYSRVSTNSLGLLMAANGLAALKEKQTAREILEKVRNTTPEFLPALEALVQMDNSEQQFATAIARLKDQMTKTPDAPEPWLLLASTHLEKAVSSIRQELGEEAGDESLLKVPAATEEVKNAEAALSSALEISPEYTMAYNLLARIWVATGREQAAIDKLSVVTARTNEMSSHLQLALIYSHLNDHEKAAQTYEKILTFVPNSVETLNNLASIYTTFVPRPARAYELAERARQLAPNLAPTADTLGWAIYQRGDYLRALPLLEEASGALPNEPEVAFHLGMTYYMLGREQLAKAALERAQASSKVFHGKDQILEVLAVLAMDPQAAGPEIVSALETHLKRHPNDLIALTRLGLVQQRSGSFAQAAESFRSVLRLFPRHARAARQLAEIYADHLNQPAEAIEAAKIARQNAPEDPAVAHLLGRLAYNQRNWAWAASLLEESARHLPNDPKIAFDLAWARYVLGKVTEAERAMQIAAEAPNFTNADQAKRFLKFIAASRNFESNQVPQELETVMSAEPDYLPGLVLLALQAQRDGRPEQASQVYERLLNTYPSFSPATRNLALLCFEHLNQDQRANELALKARQVYRNDPQIARTLGILAYRRSDPSRAIQMLREASQTLSEDAEVYFYLGLSQHALKSKEESRKALERALSLKLRQPLAAEATRLLAELNS